MEPIEQLDFISTSSFAALLNDMRNCGDDDDDYDHYSDSIDGRDHQLNHLNRRNNNNTNQVQRYRHRTQSSPSSSFNSYSSSSSSSTSSSSSSSYHQQRPPPPSSLSSMMIITGPTGSVRGKRNIVRKSINNYTELVNQSVTYIIWIKLIIIMLFTVFAQSRSFTTKPETLISHYDVDDTFRSIDFVFFHHHHHLTVRTIVPLYLL
ncbi:hypothetical protein BLOT_012920 [Blomia tropicalis]|nr:hypothetical protein BLOT_012920 [Blomia tropicalis]